MLPPTLNWLRWNSWCRVPASSFSMFFPMISMDVLSTAILVYFGNLPRVLRVRDEFLTSREYDPYLAALTCFGLRTLQIRSVICSAATASQDDLILYILIDSSTSSVWLRQILDGQIYQYTLLSSYSQQTERAWPIRPLLSVGNLVFSAFEVPVQATVNSQKLYATFAYLFTQPIFWSFLVLAQLDYWTHKIVQIWFCNSGASRA